MSGAAQIEFHAFAYHQLYCRLKITIASKEYEPIHFVFQQQLKHSSRYGHVNTGLNDPLNRVTFMDAPAMRVFAAHVHGLERVVLHFYCILSHAANECRLAALMADCNCFVLLPCRYINNLVKITSATFPRNHTGYLF